MRTTSLIVCLLGCSVLLTADESVSKRLSLGGPRKVVAEISQDDDDLKIAIEMVAVRCFDQATNKRLNRGKAEHYAHEAIARYLFPKERNRFTFVLSGTTVEKSALEGKLYWLTLRVPRNGVSQEEVSKQSAKRPKDSTSNALSDSERSKNENPSAAKINLFEVKGDYTQTLRLLSESFKTTIPTLPGKASDEQQETFFKAIANFEEMAKHDFKAFIAEIRHDKLLLTIEADELVQQIEREQADLMDLMKNTVEAATSSSLLVADLADKFSEVKIEAPFDRYLQANLLLMEVSGAKIIKLKNGNNVVIAVASTVLNDASAKERLRAEKVCRVKASASVVAEKQGILIAHTEELKEETTIVVDEKGETGKSVSELIQVTKTKSEGIAKDMPVVGRWNSKEGDVFYLAIGAIFDRNGKPLANNEK